MGASSSRRSSKKAVKASLNRWTPAEVREMNAYALPGNDRFSKLCQQAFEAVGLAHNIIARTYPEDMHPQTVARIRQEKERASRFLKRLESEIQKRAHPGRPRTQLTNREQLDLLGYLAMAKNVDFKTAIIESLGNDASETLISKTRNSFQRESYRFCERVYGVLYQLYPSHIDSPGVLKITSIADASIRSAFENEDWPGSVFPKDISAFRKAAEIHLQRLHAKRKR